MIKGEESRADTNSLPLLAELPPFANLDGDLLTKIAAELSWFSLPSGQTLLRAGDQTENLYIVTSGLLGVVVSSDQGNGLVAEIQVGETIGEMALVTGEPHSATVIALRHCELLAMPKEVFERLVANTPGFLRWITTLVVNRLRATTHRAAVERHHTAIAIVPLDPSLDIEDITRSLLDSVSRHRRKVHCFNPDSAELPISWFNEIEAAHELVLYRTNHVGAELDRWTRFCLRQADRIVLVSRSNFDAPKQILEVERETKERSQPVDLLIIEPAQALHGSAPQSAVHFNHIYHLREGYRPDIDRYARHLTDRSVGLVLSGGAARGFGHVGAIRAIREAGIPIDRVGGTSIGAVVAGCVANGWDDQEIRSRLYASFVERNPLSDYTIPTVALFRGRGVEKLLQKNFGDIVIEALWLPFFCVSSNLTSGGMTVHRRDTLWRAIRASIAIPGIFPPVIEQGEVLVDGGVMNTFPVDIMADSERGPIIGVNVATQLALAPNSERPVLKRRFPGITRSGVKMPGIVDVLMHAGTISSSLQASICRTQATLLIEPPLSHVSLLDWQAFDRAVEAGYRHTIGLLERTDLKALQLLR